MTREQVIVAAKVGEILARSEEGVYVECNGVVYQRKQLDSVEVVRWNLKVAECAFLPNSNSEVQRLIKKGRNK